ncbi:MAG: hypothetical protein F6K58_18120 [Symploca sp. SIO2E9]|nr:hypothetical protein [Symploca sp. SIO2E9]
MVDTYNPIIGQEKIKGWRLFQQRPVPDAQTALVFSGEGQPLLTIKQGQRGITSGEMVWGKYHVLYRVDLTEHPLSFRCDLPCKTDAFVFNAEVTFICSVHNPAMIVQRNVTDVSQVLKPLIVEVMRSKSRNYDTEDSGIAERDIGNSVKQAIYDAGFQVNRFVLELSLEKEAREHIREKTRIQKQTEIEKTRLQSSIELERQQRELDKQRQEYELERKKRDEEFELERMKLKMDFYGPMIQAGNWQILAMQLAQNPEDVQVIVQQLNQQTQLEREHQMKMLKMLIDEDALEGSQITEVSKVALQKLLGIAEQSIPKIKGSSNQNANAQDAVLDVNPTDNDTSEVKTPDFDDWDEDD